MNPAAAPQRIDHADLRALLYVQGYRDAEIRALADPDRVLAEHGGLLVNRYVVDAVDAELMLGFFFPGARLTVRTSAGVDADPVAARAVGTPPGPAATGPAERRPGMLGSVGEGTAPS